MLEKVLEIAPEIQILILVNFMFVLFLLILNIVNSMRIRSLKSKYKKFMSGAGKGNVEQVLDDCLESLNKNTLKYKEIDKRVGKIEGNLLQCVQKVGIIRYNAFENTGSDMSFSIALLDRKEDGVVISGIYSRDSSATYAKPIVGGISKYVLSDEEEQAMEIAKKNHTGE
jgi:hypothetical protein